MKYFPHKNTKQRKTLQVTVRKFGSELLLLQRMMSLQLLKLVVVLIRQVRACLIKKKKKHTWKVNANYCQKANILSIERLI